MPFVIDEVVINIEVPPAAAAPALPGGTGGASSAADRQALVAEIVEQVLDILQRRDEP